MYYTIRPAGPRTKKELVQYYLLLISMFAKWVFSLSLLTLGVIAVITKNYGALAVLGMTLLLLVSSFNFLNLRRFVPGLRRGSWFSKTIAVSLYIFMALAVLLISSPTQP